MLVTHLTFISCDQELGLGPGIEDTALSGTRWALIRHTARKHGGKCVLCQKKGEWCSDCHVLFGGRGEEVALKLKSEGWREGIASRPKDQHGGHLAGRRD